ncbi:MAG: glycoside hydrolase family 88 protein [Lachnospiraceae bacterium]|nr:glycoside hydrolase family 88 protein [Lachnospiraceae bacterium]
MDRTWAQGAAKKLIEKMQVVTARSKEKIPYRTQDGVFDDCSDDAHIGWWTNGFWGGEMWQLYHLTGEEMYREAALLVEEKLDAVLLRYQDMDHDSGFRYLPTAVAHWRVDHNEASKNRGLLAAANLAGRFNLQGQFIRAWNDFGNIDRRGFAIIDCMMNLPLLYWASEVTEDPRFEMIARAHANTCKKAFLREDGSAHHIVNFDIATGDMKEAVGGQGYGVGSSWTRGQAWALYGFTLSYLHGKDPEYLAAAKASADYFISCIPESGPIPVDFRQPRDVTWEDSTAAAIAACGLIELYRCLIKDAGEGWTPDAEKYLSAAMKLLRTLDEQRCIWGTESDALLTKCTAAYHDAEHEFTIIYGDYFFIEAIMKLLEKELFIW